jgi:hypothetical protein
MPCLHDVNCCFAIDIVQFSLLECEVAVRVVCLSSGLFLLMGTATFDDAFFKSAPFSCLASKRGSLHSSCISFNPIDL